MSLPGQSLMRNIVRMTHISSNTEILNHNVLMCQEPTTFSLL